MPRRFQFSLRALFVLVTVVGIWLGVQVNSARRQAAIVSAIEQVDGFVYYDWQFGEDDHAQKEVAELRNMVWRAVNKQSSGSISKPER